jgi:hypothetical protein
MRIHLALAMLWLFAASSALAQEQVDQGDFPAGKTAIPLDGVTIRFRVTKATGAAASTQIAWRRGGEGLGGTVERGALAGEDNKPDIAINGWTAATPLTDIIGKGKGTRFATIVVTNGGKKAAPLSDVVMDVEIAEKGKPSRTFAETAPKGATIGLVVPAAANREAAIAGIQGLSTYAAHRRQELEAKVGPPTTRPSQFGVLGHLAGYGEGSGYGIRHSNPQIVAEECRTLELLGMNGLVAEKSVALADAAGIGKEFRRIYWGGPGSGSPMGFLSKGKNADPNAACPFDPSLPAHMQESVQKAIAEHKAVRAQQSWGIWWDEIGVAAKEHIQECPRCREAFVAFLKTQGIKPAEVGAENWDAVKPYRIWQPALAADKGANAAGGAKPQATAGGKGKKKTAAAPANAPTTATDGLLYYYTFRFLTYETAQLFPESAKKLKENGVLLYAMQGPTPSWSGHSLDWHEFYDLGANTALVFETSNRDPRIWQWESYLGDIMRGISTRHDLPIGSLIKPHRGAPLQRMLSLVSRGVQNFEWYTYGPDYAKGDSFSQSPLLLQDVARAGRFLAQAEPYLYGAKPVPAEVAFVSPRSSEIWGKMTEPGIAPFEDAKWVYLALRHAHVPVDVLSEQQLAEGKLQQYKVIYVVGPNLRRDAGAKLTEWVKAGGTLWTDALGLARDEANQPAAISKELLGLGERKLQKWGIVEGYKATTLAPIAGTAPAEAAIELPRGVGEEKPSGTIMPAAAREILDPGEGKVLLQFADGKPAMVFRQVGHGAVHILGCWAGVTYSERVRRSDFDMTTDYPEALNLLISGVGRFRTQRPIVCSSPLVEPILLTKGGQRCVTLANWAYRHNPAAPAHAASLESIKELRVELHIKDVKTVRSLMRGPLKLQHDQDVPFVVLHMDEIDVLIIE